MKLKPQGHPTVKIPFSLKPCLVWYKYFGVVKKTKNLRKFVPGPGRLI